MTEVEVVRESIKINPMALQKLTYGLYVVSSCHDEKFNAQIANSVFQIASSPPAIAISIRKTNLTHEYIKASRLFTASVLCQDTPLSFIGQLGFKSGRDVNKFEYINYKTGVTGCPVVTDNAVAFLEARVVHEIEVGTHTVFIGEVVEADMICEKECLTYNHYQQVKRGTVSRSAPSYTEKEDKPSEMLKYRCKVCGYVYDPDAGDPEGNIKPGTPFEQVPGEWACPVCGAGKDEFEKME